MLAREMLQGSRIKYCNLVISNTNEIFEFPSLQLRIYFWPARINKLSNLALRYVSIYQYAVAYVFAIRLAHANQQSRQPRF